MINKKLLKKIRKVYARRLLEALKEVDVLDREGNVLISKDLKVVHKDSGYEYTVDDVVKTPDGLSIVLRDPESPRFNAPHSTMSLAEIDVQIRGGRLQSQDPDVEGDGDIFIVDEKSFEEEYEVK